MNAPVDFVPGPKAHRLHSGTMALVAMAIMSGCGSRAETYGFVHDAGLAADGRTLFILVEYGTETTASSNNMWRGDITTARPESMRIHAFDRSSGQPGRVLRLPPPPGDGQSRPAQTLATHSAIIGTPVTSLQDCRELYTECAITTSPAPYLLNRRVVDPQGGRMITWDGRQLVVAPFAMQSSAQMRAERDALFRRTTERMHAAAVKDFGARAVSEDPERIETGAAGTIEREPGMTASYRLMPGRVTFARMEYADQRFNVTWDRTGACVTNNAAVASAIGCAAGDDGAVSRVTSGIPLARAPDPDRTGTTWGVIASEASKDTPAGTTTAACHGMPRDSTDKACNAPDGTTACRMSRPLLCSHRDAALPANSPLARRLALTAPVRGTELTSPAVADALCQKALGAGWQMTNADESTFKYQVTGLGSLPAETRFWVRNGGGLANCW